MDPEALRRRGDTVPVLLVQPGPDGTFACVTWLTCGCRQRRAVLLGRASSRTFTLLAGEAPGSRSACSVSSCRITLSMLFPCPAGALPGAEELGTSCGRAPANARRLSSLREGSRKAAKVLLRALSALTHIPRQKQPPLPFLARCVASWDSIPCR